MTARPARRFPGDATASSPDRPEASKPAVVRPSAVNDPTTGRAVVRSPFDEPAVVDIHLSRTIARFMDDLIVIPGTNFGIGLDALVGLVPGIGDATGTALSGAVMIDAIRVRVPIHVLLRMGWNVVLDTVLGILPFVGDIADVAHRANRKNYRLLERAVAQGDLVPVDHRTYVLRAVAILVGSLAVCIAGAALSLWLLWRMLFG